MAYTVVSNCQLFAVDKKVFNSFETSDKRQQPSSDLNKINSGLDPLNLTFNETKGYMTLRYQDT